MTTGLGVGTSRRARTRAALIETAQHLLAQDSTDVSVLDITREAGVGVGSFYNHFDSKGQLFDAAIDAAAEQQGITLDALDTPDGDPAVLLAQKIRVINRTHRAMPSLSRALIARVSSYYALNRGLVPRVRRDLQHGSDSGRFSIVDIEAAVVAIVGSVALLGQRLHDDPELDDAVAADRCAETMLRMVGIDHLEASRIVQLPLSATHRP